MSQTRASSRLLTNDVHTAPLEPLVLDACAVVAGTPRTGALSLGAIAEVEIGLWEITPGVVTDVECEEVFVVLSGAGRVVFADQSALDLRPGTLVHLRAGDHTRWIIEQTLRKVYLSAPPPPPLPPAADHDEETPDV